MVVARSYPSAARLQDGSRVTLFHADLRLRSQALRQEAGKYRRHVLNDDHGYRKVARKGWHENGKGIGPSRGYTDGNNVDSLFTARECQARRERLGSHGCGQRRRTGNPQGAATNRFDLRNQLRPNAFQPLGGTSDVGRLGDIVRSALGERVEGGFRAALGKGAVHDDRQRRERLADPHQRPDPIQFRHFHIKNDDIRIDLGDLREGNLAVSGSSGDFELRIGRQARH